MLIEATKRRNPHAEEIAAEYVVRLLSGRHKKATVSQAYIDIVRVTQVNTRSKYKDLQYCLQNSLTKTGEMPQFEEEPKLSMDSILDLKKIMSLLKDERLLSIFTQYLEGKNFNDIAKNLKVTESYIHQLFKKEVERLKDILL
jgi:DNA-directed RNA polymerase specialized sigma subunit